MVQTILGSGGAIGIPLAKELKNYTDSIRLVSRNPKKVNDTDELFPLDVYNLQGIEKAIEGSTVVYVTIGFEYRLKVWQKIWPAFMKAVIEACKKHQSKLVFFDNVYVYDKSAIPFMTEDSPLNPPSEKGKVRLQLYEMIMNEVANNNLTAIIARAADFYGPENRASVLSLMVAENLLKGKKAQSFGNINTIHTYTYTPDAAKATALLGNTEDTWNQVWHLPTTKEKITVKEWINMIADELKVELRIQHLPLWMIRFAGIFVPVMREFPEMLYQNNSDYIFDSTKFEKRFGMIPTPAKVGVKTMIDDLRNKTK
ncbi:MAG: NAD-dependent epimerase/dehydratase family protein [Prolixibacteraceae bacterium]|nr:NAD-dependent epimerase/dehydratase family protein [Prolixibacteraceae bacterium]